MSSHKTTALVTGASAGLGREFCRQLAAHCDVIIAVARRAEALRELAAELAGTTEVHCIEADLTTIEGVTRTVETLRHKMTILDQHCADAGRDPGSIKRTAVALLFMSEDNAFLEKMRNADLQQAAIIGTPAEVKEIVANYEAAGVDELIVPDFTLGPKEQKIATLDTFIKEVAGR